MTALAAKVAADLRQIGAWWPDLLESPHPRHTRTEKPMNDLANQRDRLVQTFRPYLFTVNDDRKRVGLKNANRIAADCADAALTFYGAELSRLAAAVIEERQRAAQAERERDALQAGGEAGEGDEAPGLREQMAEALVRVDARAVMSGGVVKIVVDDLTDAVMGVLSQWAARDIAAVFAYELGASEVEQLEEQLVAVRAREDRSRKALAAFDGRGVMSLGHVNFDVPTPGEVLDAWRAALDDTTSTTPGEQL